jgi:nucleoside-diphosphate-sugar epimerase
VESGAAAVPIIREPARWAAAGIALVPRIARLEGSAGLRAALRDATHVVSTAHARYAAAVIAAAPPNARFVFLGSTRKFTRWPDDHGNGVIAGEAAFLASGRAGVMLHPTMIYGAQGEDNVRRLATVLRRAPVLPLPNSGAALVQPIHQDDVTRAVIAALDHDWDGPHTIVIAGPRPIRYAHFVRAVAVAAGIRPPLIVPCPAAPLIMFASLTRLLPFLPTVRTAEIRRLLEDKAFDIRPMRSTLRFDPMPLEEGLARTFARSHNARSGC